MTTQIQTKLSAEWFSILGNEFEKTYFKNLMQKVAQARNTNIVFPADDQVFQAFNWVLPDQVKVVILGQDPYHGVGQAMGLSFSVPCDFPLPPSLRNMFQELEADLGIKNLSGDLTPWARQGVLLLNTVLTVNQGAAASHQGWGWEIFTHKVIEIVARDNPDAVFILLGKPAQAKEKIILKYGCSILAAAHPSPLSAYRGFLGSKIFSQTNHLLKQKGLAAMNWKT